MVQDHPFVAGYPAPVTLPEKRREPLISLMQDQVDAPLARGYPATALYGGLSAAE
ncbi:MAG: hypothetical protein AB1486_19845 [Planctomycetota bacterium]